jgi:site-specific DNA recombinase
LYRLLTNLIYTGNVEFKGQVYDGEHEAILEAETWESVQQILHRNGRSGGIEVRKECDDRTNRYP